MGLLMIPLMTITVYVLPNRDIPQAAALTNMVRQLGGSFGIAIATTYISIRSVFHYNTFSEHISIYNQATYDRLNSYTGLFMSKGNDLISSQQSAAIAALKASVYKQAMVLTYNDVFLIVSVFFAVCIPLLFLFRLKRKKVGNVVLKVEMHLAD